MRICIFDIRNSQNEPFYEYTLVRFNEKQVHIFSLVRLLPGRPCSRKFITRTVPDGVNCIVPGLTIV